ncbi:MAG: hypothetical protein ABIR06_08305 [Cyclobacteriaceae bacterium]
MENQTLKIIIDAPQKKVWEILWSDASYQEWTSVFSPGSRAESDWKEGDKILLLDGNNNGMVSIIAAKKPYSFMSFKHLGEGYSQSFLTKINNSHQAKILIVNFA